MDTPTVPPVVRVLRTILQLLTAVPLVIVPAVALLAMVGIDVDGPFLVALALAAVAVVVAVMNALEQVGLIPTLGARVPANAPLTEGWPVQGAPLFTADEVRDIIGTPVDDRAVASLLRLERATGTGTPGQSGPR